MKSGRHSRHPQIHLPPLDAAYALTLVEIFERAIAAVWRAHGDRMAALLERRHAASRAPVQESEPDDDHGDGQDDLLPF